MEHVTVLKKEAVDLLDVKKNGTYVDATLGRGGHSLEILKRLENGRLYCFDLDSEAIEKSKEILKDYLEKIVFINDNYCNMFKYVDCVDGILLDLGVSSPQFDDEKRGFSYRFDSKLDMRMNKSQEKNAYDIVNGYDEKQLTEIFRKYGEEKYSYQIAKNIVKKRLEKAIETTFELVEIIKKSQPMKSLKKKGHPAKQIFQALRIVVNDEMESLEKFLKEFPKHLKKDGTVAIISFHSLEDGLVKKCFNSLTRIEDDKRIVLKQSELPKPEFELLNKKIIIASDEELSINHRSKSAKLRGIKKL